MALTILGDHPTATDGTNLLKSRIGTIFPRHNVLVTVPGIHATQRLVFLEHWKAQRLATQQPAWTEADEAQACQESVDLFFEPDRVLIRPDPDNMKLAFEADELLQELVSKLRIKFLHVTHERVRQAIKERGECWRISPLPRLQRDIKIMIEQSRVPIQGLPIYYYNRLTGTRYLTCHEFARLEEQEPAVLAQHLAEIRDFAGRTNRQRQPEIAFFQTDAAFNASAFPSLDFATADPAQVKSVFQALKDRFHAAVRKEMRLDDVDNPEWVNQMFATLVGPRNDDKSAEHIPKGLGSEYQMHVEWLAGFRIEDGELILDSIFEELEQKPLPLGEKSPCDPRVREYIFNFTREFGELEYVNVALVAEPLAKRDQPALAAAAPAPAGASHASNLAEVKPRGLKNVTAACVAEPLARRDPLAPAVAAPAPASERRGTYLAEVKPRGLDQPEVLIIRMQKWDITWHLDQGKDLLTAMREAADYSDYVLNRRLGCRQLGMNLPPRIRMFKLAETYTGKQIQYVGQTIWSTYFEREYFEGIATDKIPKGRLEDFAYALQLGQLLGKAAALNIIVGRTDNHQRVLFDDGDEIVVEEAGSPREIIVADPTGAFADYLSPLGKFAPEYGQRISRLLPYVAEPQNYVAVYLAAFMAEFARLQTEYRKRRRAFDSLFRHSDRDIRGSFAYRWEKILERLDGTDFKFLAWTIKERVSYPLAKGKR